MARCAAGESLGLSPHARKSRIICARCRSVNSDARLCMRTNNFSTVAGCGAALRSARAFHIIAISGPLQPSAFALARTTSASVSSLFCPLTAARHQRMSATSWNDAWCASSHAHISSSVDSAPASWHVADPSPDALLGRDGGHRDCLLRGASAHSLDHSTSDRDSLGLTPDPASGTAAAPPPVSSPESPASAAHHLTAPSPPIMRCTGDAFLSKKHLRGTKTPAMSIDGASAAQRSPHDDVGGILRRVVPPSRPWLFRRSDPIFALMSLAVLPGVKRGANHIIFVILNVLQSMILHIPL